MSFNLTYTILLLPTRSLEHPLFTFWEACLENRYSETPAERCQVLRTDHTFGFKLLDATWSSEQTVVPHIKHFMFYSSSVGGLGTLFIGCLVFLLDKWLILHTSFVWALKPDTLRNFHSTNIPWAPTKFAMRDRNEKWTTFSTPKIPTTQWKIQKLNSPIDKLYINKYIIAIEVSLKERNVFEEVI